MPRAARLSKQKMTDQTTTEMVQVQCEEIQRSVSVSPQEGGQEVTPQGEAAQGGVEQEVTPQGEGAEESQGGEPEDAGPKTFKALEKMQSYADYLVAKVNLFTSKMKKDTFKNRQSVVLSEYSLPNSQPPKPVTEMYFAGIGPNGEYITPSRENGGYPIVLLVMGPKRKLSSKVTALSLANAELKDYFLTSSRGRIYLNKI